MSFCSLSSLSRGIYVDQLQAWMKLLPLARLSSQRTGETVLTAKTPFLEGTLTGLERFTTDAVQGPLSDALVERIATLFNAYSPQELEIIHFKQAPLWQSAKQEI